MWPSVLPQGQIRLRVGPWLSYAAASGGGAVELIEEASEVVAPSGQKVALGGATSSLHAVTRRILGYRDEQTSAEAGISLTATLH